MSNSSPLQIEIYEDYDNIQIKFIRYLEQIAIDRASRNLIPLTFERMKNDNLVIEILTDVFHYQNKIIDNQKNSIIHYQKLLR